MSELCLWKLDKVIEVSALSRSTILRKVEDGTFPKPVEPTSGSKRWRSDHIEAWIRSLVSINDNKELDPPMIFLKTEY